VLYKSLREIINSTSQSVENAPNPGGVGERFLRGFVTQKLPNPGGVVLPLPHKKIIA
jgi:hypothetical protein